MTEKVLRGEEDLRAQLAAQLGFLRSSATAFDDGFTDEAKRMAVAIRILVHDTTKSRSVLGQLGHAPLAFVSTCIPFEPATVNAWTGLLWFDVASPLGDRYLAMLDGAMRRAVPFAQWWNEVVLMDDRRQTMSRRQLIVTMCDQDGGAHVDPALEEGYERLSRRNSLGWVVVDSSGRRPMREPEKYSVRQIAHEVLRTLDATYPEQLAQVRGSLMGGISVFDEIPDSMKALAWRRTTGRNDPCLCGSGKKFKKCHL